MGPSFRSHLAPVVAILAIALVTACSGSAKASKSQTIAAVPGSTTMSSGSSTVSPSGTTTTPVTTSSVTADSVALSVNDINAKCAGLGATTPSDGSSPSDGSTASDVDGGGDASSTGSGQASAITSHGVVVVACSQPSVALIAVDLAHGTDLWNYPLQTVDPSADSSQDTAGDYLLGVGDENAYVLSITHIAATGLKDAYVTRTVSAINLQTGSKTWTQPLDSDDQHSDSTRGTVTEAPGPTAGHREVVINVNDYSTFDADTGRPLWRVPDLHGSLDTNNTIQFVAYDLALFVSQETAVLQLGAVDVATGKTRWIQDAGATNVSLQNDTKTELVGSQFWFIGQTGVDAYEVTSGKHTVHRLFPTSFQKVMATPTRTVALVDGTLRCFVTGDWSRPLWSVDAGDVTPQLVTDSTLVLDAQSGDQLLSMTDGSIIGAAPDGIPGNGPVVDGLQIAGDGSVFAYSPPS